MEDFTESENDYKARCPMIKWKRRISFMTPQQANMVHLERETEYNVVREEFL